MGLVPIGNLKPDSYRGNSDAKAFKRALAIFREASRRVPAYKDFLRKHKIKADKIRTKSDFSQVPPVDKVNYISRYNLEDLSWDGVLHLTRHISTSSGSTGIPFYWPRGNEQEKIVGMIFHELYDDIFGAKEKKILCVNSFSLGTWIAGIELYNSTRWSANNGNKIIIITPGIDRDEAIKQIKKLGGGFGRIVLAGYPPFVKDIIELGKISGINWKKMDICLLTGGEAFSEAWREYMLSLIGKKPDDPFGVINMYGMAETGVVGHETPTSIVLRRMLRDENGSGLLPEYNRDISIYQYYPTARYFQTEKNGSLILTSDSGFPIVRYATRDIGGILDFQDVIGKTGNRLAERAKKLNVDLKKWQLPFIYLYGRKDLSVSFYGLNVYVENVKRAFENSKIYRKLSGLFVMSVENTSKFDPYLKIVIELSRGISTSAELRKTVSETITNKLREINSEYAKLYKSIGKRALPRIKLVEHGKIDTIPGRKHKWIKRN